MSRLSLARIRSFWIALIDTTRHVQRLDLKQLHQWPIALKILLCTLLGIFAAWGIWNFQVRDKAMELMQAKAMEIELRKELQNTQLKAITWGVLQQQYEQLHEQMGILEQMLPRKADVAALLAEINHVGIKRKLRFGSFKPGSEHVKAYYAEVPVTFSAVGSFHEIGQFVADISSLARVVTLGQLLLRPAGNTDDIVLEATAKTYRYLDSEEAVGKQ